MKRFLYVFALLGFCIATPSLSQQPLSKSQTGITLFEDNQSSEVAGQVPAKWKVLSGRCIIEKYGGKNVLSLPGDETKITPKTDINALLSNGFEASFEFFYTRHGGQRYYCRLSDYPAIEFKQDEISCGELVTELPVSDAADQTWHKIMIRFDSKQIRVYINDHLELTVQDAVKPPNNFSLANWQTGGYPYYVRNVHIKGSGVQAPQIALLSPANNASVTNKNLTFSWKSKSPSQHSKYILSVFEIKPGQTTNEAVKNSPSYQKEMIDIFSSKYLIASKEITRNKYYCWNVKQVDGTNEYVSETRTFMESGTTPLKFPAAKISCDTNGKSRLGDPCKIVIMEVKGEVEVRLEPNGRWQTAVPGMEIPPGATVCSGEGSSAVVGFGTSSVAMIQETSLMTIKKFTCTDKEARAEVYIDPGACTVSVKQLPQFQTDFQVSTPRLTCSVRG